jgi:hypothetical protein
MSHETRRNDNTPVFDDPESRGGRTAMIKADIAKVTVYNDQEAGGGDLWKREKGAKSLVRADLWAQAGYGFTDKFDNWTTAELHKLRDAVAMHLEGRMYSGAKYVCSCCG